MGLGAGRLEHLLPPCPPVRTVGEGGSVALRQTPCHNLLILLAGQVRGEITDNKGHALEVETLAPPRALAPAFLFGPHPEWPVDVVAVTDCRLLVLERALVLDLAHREPRIMRNLLDMISGRAQFLSLRLWSQSHKTLRQKLAFYLLNYARQQGGTLLTLDRTIQELSEYLGVQRPSLSRTLKELNDRGILRYDQGRVHIPDPGKLKALLDES